MARNNYKELTFGNDFIFAKVMRNQKLCKKLLEVILGIEISSIEYIEDQLTLASLVKDGMLAPSDAAAKAGMSEGAFKKQTGLM